MFGREVVVNGYSVGTVVADVEEKLTDTAINAVYGKLCEKMDPVSPLPDNFVEALEELGYSVLSLVFEQPLKIGRMYEE